MADETPLAPLLDALCRAAFAPQSIVQYSGVGGAPEIVPTPSPLVIELGGSSETRTPPRARAAGSDDRAVTSHSGDSYPPSPRGAP